MEGPVNPVAAQIDHNQNFNELQPQGLAGDGLLEADIHLVVQQHLNRDDGEEADQLQGHMAEQEVLHVRHPATAQGLLFPVLRVGALQRNKDQPQHQQCQDKIIQAGIQATAINRWHIQAPGTD